MRFSLLATSLSAAALALAVAAEAQDLPKRKSGLWEIKTSGMQAGNGPGQSIPAASVQMCIDEKTDNAAQQQAAGMSKQNCTKQDMKKTATGMVVDSVCKLGPTTATTHSVFTGSFDSGYKVETKSTYEPPMSGMKESAAVIEAHWVGPCKADQRPGDMILGNGMKINMNDMQKGGMPPQSAPRK